MPDPLEFRLIDAFAHAPCTGNVAAVVLDADRLSDRQMQLLAAEFNASETVFTLRPTLPDAAVRFRGFAPAGEVRFCGHATLAAVHALLDAGRFAHPLDRPGTLLPIETRAGLLTVRTERAAPFHPPAPSAGPAEPPSGAPPPGPMRTLWLDMPRCEPKPAPLILPPLLRPLGLDGDSLDPALPPIRTRDDDVILAVKSLQRLFDLRPTMADLARACRKERIRGILVTTPHALSAATVTQSRFFAPAVGIDEDPVTGSVHGPLGLHLVNSGIIPLHDGRADFHCAQARAGGRAGLVRVVVTRDRQANWHVRIGGACVTTAAGVLRCLPEES